MSKKNDGGPAFPRSGFRPDFGNVASDDITEAIQMMNRPEDGMTLRDWFAGQALPEMIRQFGCDSHDAPRIAPTAYQIADAMIAARGT